MPFITRRETLGSLAAIPMFATARASATIDAPRPGPDKVLTRIAFGSCADQSKPQPIWKAILAAQPDLFIFLGDNIYADTRDPAVMARKYRLFADQPGFAALRERVPLVAIWDDHDFGEDDAGGDYPMKAESRLQFCDFWKEAADSPRRTREGIYTSYIYGPAGQRVQILLPDLRWNRTPLRKKMGFQDIDYKTWMDKQIAAHLPAPGPYDRIPDLDASMLGEPQWRWLEKELTRPADVRIFASSLQVLADFAGWEGWINFARDHQRLFQAIRSARAEGMICISGDTHYGEISRLDLNTSYPIWDFTSSGLTEVWPVVPDNALRRGSVWSDQNFGLIEIDWAAKILRIEIRDVTGRGRLVQQVPLNSLKV